jgi:hypothetical protein
MVVNSNPDALEIIRISEKELRQKFNDGRFWDGTKSGELTKVILSRHIPQSSHEPAGTESQIISLRDSNDQEVARAHIYFRPDGTLGASGWPDPKIIRAGNILYMQKKKR